MARLTTLMQRMMTALSDTIYIMRLPTLWFHALALLTARAFADSESVVGRATVVQRSGIC